VRTCSYTVLFAGPSYIHTNLPPESLCLFKKTYQNPLGSLKDLSIQVQTAESVFVLYIQTYHSRFIFKGVAEAQVVSPSPSISGVNAINPLVAFNDIHGRKREVILFYFSRTQQTRLFYTML
jgi:hypothetical protein